MLLLWLIDSVDYMQACRGCYMALRPGVDSPWHARNFYSDKYCSVMLAMLQATTLVEQGNFLHRDELHVLDSA